MTGSATGSTFGSGKGRRYLTSNNATVSTWFSTFGARLLASLFPAMAWGIFFVLEKQRADEFLQFPVGNELEAQFFLEPETYSSIPTRSPAFEPQRPSLNAKDGLLKEVTMRKSAPLCLLISLILCGPLLAQNTSELQAKQGKETRFCDQFPGETAGARIAACIADIPMAGGIADATRLEGFQVINSTLNIGSPAKPVALLLGPATFSLNSASLNLYTGSYILGSGGGRDLGKATTIRRTAGRLPLIQANGSSKDHVRGFGIANLRIDGDSSGGDGIVLRNVDTFRINGVHMANGSGSSALRLLDEVWDFWVVNSSFTVWGDKTHPTVELIGANAMSVVTDGHWHGNQFGELGRNNPILFANPFVLQQRFIDNKFHITGLEMPYMVEWSGYRSSFVNCSFQADSKSTSGGLVRIKNADNQILGGHFTDINNGDAIHVSLSGDLIVSGVNFRSAGRPGPGAAIVTEASSIGRITAVANDIVNFSVGYNFREGRANVVLGPTNFRDTSIEVLANDGKTTWNEYNFGKMTAVFGGANPPASRSPLLNPTVRIGGGTTNSSAGFQGLYLAPEFSERGQINELLGMGTSWLAGIGSMAGRNIEHPFAWCYDSDVTEDCFSIFRKSAETPIATNGKLASITTTGDLRFQQSRGQHLQTYMSESDMAGRLVLNEQGRSLLKFEKRWGSPPICVASDTHPAATVIRVQTTTEELLLSGAAGHTVNYICMGNPN